MIVIHHLGVSQSDRVVWLMEELGLPYELRWHDRGPDFLAPDGYRALHPAATAPVIEDGERVLTESAVILEHICHRHAGGRLTVRPEQANYADYLYWMHFNASMLGIYFTRGALASGASGTRAERLGTVIARREAGALAFLEQTLAKHDWLAGPEFTCADIMCAFGLTPGSRYLATPIEETPNAAAWLERIRARPAYRRAQEIAGPKATRPA
ncbi:glutathione S-transferase family protein [Albimonas pacifica]|uniref:Glutathione S-transferase n=1 Tax=Albimonas pacifica TaxID=1114924 RepID=A0A1I3F307_9RHOB|nr:glutathione S-transferase family protein [Albimonas pacifica]SFI05629.1 glutathione S-transferase [Albimonas pacifica]